MKKKMLLIVCCIVCLISAIMTVNTAVLWADLAPVKAEIPRAGEISVEDSNLQTNLPKKNIPDFDSGNSALSSSVFSPNQENTSFGGQVRDLSASEDIKAFTIPGTGEEPFLTINSVEIRLTTAEKVLLDNVIEIAVVNAANEAGATGTVFIKMLISGDYQTAAILFNNDGRIGDSLIRSFEDEYGKAALDNSLSVPMDTYLNSELQKLKALRADPAQREDGQFPSPRFHVTPKDLEDAFKPFTDHMREVMNGLGYGTGPVFYSRSDFLEAWLSDFSDEAAKVIRDTFTKAKENINNEALSNALEKDAFAAEPVLPDGFAGVPLLTTGMVPGELCFSDRGAGYQILDSVYISREFFLAHKLLHPPVKLNPYLKWVLYAKRLTPKMVENYLATHRKILLLFHQAKEGKGNIRYKGKLYGAFLPFKENAPGNYELVKTARAT